MSAGVQLLNRLYSLAELVPAPVRTVTILPIYDSDAFNFIVDADGVPVTDASAKRITYEIVT